MHFPLFASPHCPPAWQAWLPALQQAVQQHYRPGEHGDEAAWQAALAALPPLPATHPRLDAAAPGTDGACSADTRQRLQQALMALHPWRKGPFELAGLRIDSEWRSDLKWQRLAPHLTPLAGRTVLDVGCGNGYYLLRMLGAGARYALGIDPGLRFLYQFAALRHYLGDIAADILPLKSEELPRPLRAFDTVFSMGVLYHRREPLEHLAELRDALVPSGELVLETLVLPPGHAGVLVPAERYAQMRNVWAIPSQAVLEGWVREAGFSGVRTVDVTATTPAEQRSTAWMTFQSLTDFLDPADASRTTEGYPAPVRAIVIAGT